MTRPVVVTQSEFREHISDIIVVASAGQSLCVMAPFLEVTPIRTVPVSKRSVSRQIRLSTEQDEAGALRHTVVERVFL